MIGIAEEKAYNVNVTANDYRILTNTCGECRRRYDAMQQLRQVCAYTVQILTHCSCEWSTWCAGRVSDVAGQLTELPHAGF